MPESIHVDVMELEKLTPLQQRLVEAFFASGCNKTAAYKAAGYKVPDDAEKLSPKVAAAFRSPLVVAAIAARQQKNLAEIRKSSPLEVMLDNMEWFAGKARENALEPSKAMAYRAMSQKCAKDAAPFMHPTLQAIAIKGQIDVRNMTDEQIESTIRELELSFGQALGTVAGSEDGKGKKA